MEKGVEMQPFSRLPTFNAAGSSVFVVITSMSYIASEKTVHIGNFSIHGL